jgi:hypothetical protein
MGGNEDDMILAVKISPAEGPLYVSLLLLRVKDAVDLDKLDRLALRALLLGIHHRTLKALDVARGFMVQACVSLRVESEHLDWRSGYV